MNLVEFADIAEDFAEWVAKLPKDDPRRLEIERQRAAPTRDLVSPDNALLRALKGTQ